MRSFLLAVALCCGELAVLMLAFVWCVFPGPVGWVQAHHLNAPALMLSMVLSIAGCFWVGHAIIDRYGD